MNAAPRLSRFPRFASVLLLLAAGCSARAPAGTAPAGPASAGSTGSVASRPTEPRIDRAALRAELAAHRAEELAHLHEYAAAGRFPHDVTTAPSLHMFRDPEGRLCAVANLIQADGRGDLVDATVLARNDLAIADVHDGELMAWIEHSGLTQEELVRIQLPAPYIGKRMRPAGGRPVVVARKVSPEEEMNAAVVRHVAEVETELRANTERSLELAVERLVVATAS